MTEENVQEEKKPEETVNEKAGEEESAPSEEVNEKQEDPQKEE